MGRIKGTLVKRTTKALMNKYKGQFSENFEANKKVIDTVHPGIQKKIKNSVSGFIARKIKREKAQEKKNLKQAEQEQWRTA
jgi:small subunit ribosomal protein S17e